jgi:hypothetical protein
MKAIPKFGAVAAAALLATTGAHATLIDRGGGLIYDDLLNVTWLQDANYAGSTGVAPNGLMNWNEARGWAANLSYADSARGTTWDDWRLPTAAPINGSNWQLAPTTDGSTDWSYNITSSEHELSHLFHVSLKNLSGFLPNGTPRPGVSGVDYGMVNTGPFTNLFNDIYWYGTDSPFNPGTHAVSFLGYSGGDLGNALVGSRFHAIALRDGDVGAVPEPASWALVLVGLAAIGGLARRRHAQALRQAHDFAQQQGLRP